jgi:hypothetical protein
MSTEYARKQLRLAWERMKPWRLSAVPLMAGGIVLVALAMPHGPAASAPPRPRVAPPQVVRPKVNMARIEAGLAQADRASAAAIDASALQVASYLVGCRKNGQPFAAWVLGLGAKGQYALGRMEQASAFLRHLVMKKSMPPASSLPDRFGDELRRKFSEMVMNPETARYIVANAVASYAERVRDIEARLAVETAADIPDEALALGAPPSIDTGHMFYDIDTALTGTMKLAEGDLLFGVIREVLMNRVGDAITDHAGADNLHPALNFTADTATGMALDGLVDKGLKRIGYDPEGKITVAVQQSLDRLTYTVITRLRQTLTEFHNARSARRALVVREAFQGR